MKASLASLESFAKEFPHHPEMLEVRRRELDFALTLSNSGEVTRLKGEIQLLTPPPPTNAPPVKKP